MRLLVLVFVIACVTLVAKSGELARVKPERTQTQWGAAYKRRFGKVNARPPSVRAERKNSPEAQKFLESVLNRTLPVPEALDWRDVPGRVGPVRNRGHCDSSWAFAAAGLLEGQELVRKPNSSFVELSARDILDCVNEEYGCGGGRIEIALNTIAQRGGIESAADYPYSDTPRKGKCKYDSSKRVESVDGFKGLVYVPSYKEDTIKEIVAKYGPVSVTINTETMRDYKSGVFIGELCRNVPGMLGYQDALIVGYGRDPKDHGDYWIIKLWWGEEWGEGGYMRLQRNWNTCDVAYNPLIAQF